MNRRAFLFTAPLILVPPAPQGPWRVSGLAGSRALGTERWATEIVPVFQGPFRVLHAPVHYERWTPAGWEAID